jgi:uncharacterized protein YbcI
MPRPSGEASRRAAAASNAISRLHREYYGRGAVSSRSVIERNYVIVFMEDVYAPVERTLIEAGKQETVRATRNEFQLAMRDRFNAAIEEIMGRPVVAFMSQVHFDPDMSVEIFVLQPSDEERATQSSQHTQS